MIKVGDNEDINSSAKGGSLGIFFQRGGSSAPKEPLLYPPLQTTGLWKTACDSLAQTRETAQIYGSRILIAPPTSAYTQYK